MSLRPHTFTTAKGIIVTSIIYAPHSHARVHSTPTSYASSSLGPVLFRESAIPMPNRQARPTDLGRRIAVEWEGEMTGGKEGKEAAR